MTPVRNLVIGFPAYANLRATGRRDLAAAIWPPPSWDEAFTWTSHLSEY